MSNREIYRLCILTPWTLQVRELVTSYFNQETAPHVILPVKVNLAHYNFLI